MIDGVSRGLTIIQIFAFKDRPALELAEKCGIAFQLTNSLRDVREDFEMGRVYLPAEFRVLERRVRLSTFEKVWLVIQADGRKLVGAY